MPLKDAIWDIKTPLKHGTNLWREFKGFAFKGNMVELAIGVVVGTAFTNVVNSLVKFVIMPTISYVMPHEGGYRAWKLGRVEIGVFLGDLINFLIVASVVFLVLVKMLGILRQAARSQAEAKPQTKECCFCLSQIPMQAWKCSNCTADLALSRIRE